MKKVSIITVCFNSEATIRQCILSVVNQDYANIEYIIIDGGSTDNTISIIQEHKRDVDFFVSEKDHGIYDAMNKALKHVTGDIVGFLNSDDFYENKSVLSRIAMAFQTNGTDMVYGDLVFVSPKDTSKIARYYSVPGFKPWWLKFGIMPPHPASFLKAEVFKNYGNFKIDYQIAADYEFFVRTLWQAKISYSYLPGILVRMRSGGTSNCGLKSKLTLNKEIIKGCRENGLKTNLLFLICKIPFRLSELFKKP